MSTHFDQATKFIRHCLSATLLLFCATLAVPAYASFVNTDFSSGFSAWEGNVNDTDLGDIFADYPDNFALNGSSATLITSAGEIEDYWLISMYQDAVLASLAPNESLWLSLGVSALLSSADDFFFVQLRDLNTNDVIDLSTGGSFDISSMTGGSVTFEFGVIDNDFVLGDELTVSNINFNVTTESVPAPAGTLFVLFGFGYLMWRKGKA
ncbi:hypothetical protein [Alteromonas gilva]|uniref:PEP-CTERM sorting domain-containing protein n=1 Tax=Alteromonas gilva TaxID=2987522 RepID=A0ABT5KZ31_9ALTE|nr:hypothetical protein [Alteromonas gilva]MDC8830026.1 hypothetical protein [Alteromonas gilva]